MSIYIDADAFVLWEKGEFDLPAWLQAHPDAEIKFPATAWQQLNFGIFAWAKDRAAKRALFLQTVGEIAVVADFTRAHSERAARLAAEMKRELIGFADFQIAASALDGAELLTFNHDHFSRVQGLRLATI